MRIVTPDELRLERRERLGDLKEKGMLTVAEFRAEKKPILADPGPTGAPRRGSRGGRAAKS
jgi:hypothetical protein